MNWSKSDLVSISVMSLWGMSLNGSEGIKSVNL